jgi:NAD(P)-dependent dehydrogenase (short-subunit alcohol dehydrogenase family)
VEEYIMSWTLDDLPVLTGRRVVVTGANSGLGLETATRLAERGATVVLACRNAAKAQAAVDQLRAEVPGADVSVLPLDLADLDSVADAAAALLDDGRPVDVLVNNAGLMAVDESRTAQGFETQYGVNHLGHFALTARLVPALLLSDAPRVVNVSSMGHRAARGEADPLLDRPYDRWNAYFHSKLDNLLFTDALHRRLQAAGSPIVVTAAHPGASDTDLGSEGSGLTNRLTRLFAPLLSQSVPAGALPILRAATDADLPAGCFVGPRFVVRGRRPVVERPSRRARDTAAADRLWEQSVEQSGLDPLHPPTR